MSPKCFRLSSSAVLLAAAIFACTEGSTNPNPDNTLSIATAGSPGAADTGEFELCKHGTQAIFRVIIDGTGQPRFLLGPDQCLVLATEQTLGHGNHTVTVIEDVLKGTVFDSIVAESIDVRNKTRVRSAPITNTHQITETFNGDKGWLVDFYNH